MRLSTLLGVSILLNVALAGLFLLRAPEPVRERVVEVEPPAEGAVPPTPALAGEAPDAAKPAPPAPAPAPDLRAALGREPTAEEAAEYERYFAERVRRGPEDFARLLAQREAAAEEQARKSAEAVEDAKRGGLLAVLARGPAEGSLLAFVETPEFEHGFAPLVRGATIRLRAGEAAPERVDDGDVLVFGPGAHSFSASRWDRKPMPKDLTLEGYGMDKTLVSFGEFGDPTGAIHSLTFRDMTVDSADDYLFDLRSHPGVVRFERCRLVRFDCGHGGSVLFGVRAMALWMSGCRIEIGYGRSPPHGHVFRAGGGFVGRLDDTTIVGANLGDARGGSVLLRGCRYEDAPPGTKALVEGQAWIRAAATVVEEASGPIHTLERYRKTRPLSEINPDWAGVK